MPLGGFLSRNTVTASSYLQKQPKASTRNRLKGVFITSRWHRHVTRTPPNNWIETLKHTNDEINNTRTTGNGGTGTGTDVHVPYWTWTHLAVAPRQPAYLLQHLTGDLLNLYLRKTRVYDDIIIKRFSIALKKFDKFLCIYISESRAKMANVHTCPRLTH